VPLAELDGEQQSHSGSDVVIQMHSESRWAGGDMDANWKRIDYFVRDYKYKPQLGEFRSCESFYDSAINRFKYLCS
jgi:hypothetical protein